MQKKTRGREMMAHGMGVLAVIGLAVGSAAAQTATSRVVGAARTFISTLDEKQRQSVLFAFDDREQRVRWSNLPVRAVPRAGLSLADMPAPQRSAEMAL